MTQGTSKNDSSAPGHAVTPSAHPGGTARAQRLVTATHVCWRVLASLAVMAVPLGAQSTCVCMQGMQWHDDFD